MVMRRMRRKYGDFAAGIALAVAIVTTLMGPALAAPPTPRLKPPPPGPAYASRDDLTRLAEIQKQIERREFAAARTAADRLGNPLAKSLAKWFYFYAEDPLVSLTDADAFLDAHPEWPSLNKIRAHVEKRIPQTAPPSAVLDFFATRDPVTGEGMLHLARAEFATGKPEAGEAYVREAWKRFNFTLDDEQRLIAQYGRYLTVDEHIQRADRLLFAREATAARRVIPRLPARERAMAEARAALILGQENAATLFYNLKDDQRLDSGVLLAAVRHFRRREEQVRAMTLARQAPTEPALLRDPVRWWEERQLLMRWALEKGQYADAYAMAAGHGLEPGTQFAEAEFNAGWIALRFLNAPERAETHFAALAGAVGAPISVSRAYYWLGRAAEARGASDLAAARYRQAARYVYTYYGQLAAERVGGGALAQRFAPPVQPTPEDLARFSARPAVHALRMLADMNDAKNFLIFSYHIDDLLETPGEYAELGRLADRINATHVKVRAGKVGVGRNAFAPDVVYPLIDVPERAKRFAPPEIILGLSRQESEFNPRAYSSAGARGLMQLLPTTAEITAKKEGLNYSRAALLDDPEYNMVIGAAHLSHLFARYANSRIMTFAAYNAGPNRVTQWVEKFGDPRAAGVDPVDWVELIPFQETRNYVQRVLENAQVYRARLSDAAIAGRLAADLEIGGGAKRAGLLPNRQFAGTLPALPERTLRFASAADLGEAGPADPAEEAAAEAPAPQTAPTPDILGEADAADYLGDAPRRTATTGKQPPAAARLTPAPKTPASRAPAARPPLGAGSPADAAAKGPSPAPRIDGAANPAAAPPINMASDGAPIAGAAPPPACETYRAYVAATDGKLASASDLNAGMLAELRGGAPCLAPSALPAASSPAAEKLVD